MDEDPNFDYEMEPQATNAGYHPSAEEAMAELNSEGMAMSEVVLRSETTDKSGIDVDFDDSAHPQRSEAPLPALSAPATHFDSEEIIELVPESTEGFNHASGSEEVDDSAAQAIQDAAASAAPLAESSTSATPFGLADEATDHTATTRQGEDVEEEQDELAQEVNTSTPQNGIRHAEHFDEGRQVVGGFSAEVVESSGEEREDVPGTDMHAQYDTEDAPDTAIRVSLHGQDFVMWSVADIPSFLAASVNVEGPDASDESDEIVQVEAPALDVAKDVLWLPLDSLFASLREKSALGEFLDESHELHIAFPDLDLDVAEDNLYCRELTLDDLLQLHHGLGLPTSLHIQVSERPRFITKYNELAQHVAGLIGNQLQHSSDDEEEAANSGRPSSHVSKNKVGPAEGADAYANGVKGSHATASERQEGENGIRLHMQAVAEDYEEGVGSSSSGTRGALSAVAEGSASHSSPQAALPSHTAVEQAEQRVQSHANQDITSHALETHELGETQAEQEEEEAVDELKGEQGEEEEQQGATGYAVQGENEGEDAQEGDDREQEAGEEEEGLGGEEEEEVGEDAEVGEEEYQGEEEEYEEDYEEEGDEEYVDEVGDHGEDAEQTFYTTVNESSEAEVDELEDADQGVEQGYADTHPAEDPQLTHADETADAEQDWQGMLEVPQTASSIDLSADQRCLASPFVFVTTDEAEEGEDQIVEYVEEQSEGPLPAASPASTTSTLYQTGVQRKRGLDDEDDDNAEYEQDDYEAESKRVKVD